MVRRTLLSRVLLAGHSAAPSAGARAGVDTYGGTGEVGRHQNERCVDSYGRWALVDAAALHPAFSRHEAIDRETEIALAQPTAATSGGEKRELRNRSTDGPIGESFVVKTFH